MKDMILFPEDIERLDTVLAQLALKADLLLAVLINKDGRLLTSQGSIGQIDTVSMAALVAGNSASTLAIANLMGETEFSTMYHQGKSRHIYIAVVDENTFVCLVFDDRTNIDRVKVFARQFDRQLKEALVQVYDKTEDQVDLDLDMSAFYPGDPQSMNHNSFPEHLGPSVESRVAEPQAEVEHIHVDSVAPPSNQREQGTPEEAFYIEPGKTIGDGHDTNYLFLKKKIRETVKPKLGE